jgi:alkyl sulfatase BDS1-like metallo-beta-lactamase superfamily hydrolase
VRWAMVSFKRRYRASDREACIALSVEPSHQFRLCMRSNGLDIEEGPAQPSDAVRATLTTDGLRALLFHNTSARELLRAGKLVIDGDASAFFALVDAIAAQR